MRPTNLIPIITITCSVLLLSACGGGGGGDTAAPTTTPTAVSGKFLPEVRVNGHTPLYNKPHIKTVTDRFLADIAGALKENESVIKWPSNLPVVFSGCGTENAFFSPGLDLHADFAKEGVADPVATFGPNITGPAIVMCHDLTEKAIDTFFENLTIANTIIQLFGIDPATASAEEAAVAILMPALMFEMTVLLHEVGHAMDDLLIKDSISDSVKLQNFEIPLQNQCGKPGCNTIDEDFADWVSASVFVKTLKDAITADPTQAEVIAKSWLVALGAWDIIIGPGGDVAHGFTKARQVNMLCYGYGGIPELRTADANSLNNALATTISSQGLDPSRCETIYNINDTSTKNLLGSFMNN